MRGTDTVERDVTGPPERNACENARRPSRWWRVLTGSLAAGLALLALAVLAAEVFGWASGAAGPGALAVTGQVAGAVLALVAQGVADRARGRTAALAGLAVVALAAAVLWLFWWS
ncbi:hypothetical protein FHU38_004288 [Saccharomonospora amisosensis]|uniref:Uncharacterized protein n=1 Tax=Saccharomonospora amisosensis TaxID=1128677 RepID=A0A7X5ZSG7_9PSEU|nr:hypothetical protein [Saccharomonospora amisosensis]NIJ13944.1 hypothetical protein [Saccharomonospora amisosensis]